MLLVREGRRRGFDGVVCGHIHKAQIHTIDGLLYCNCGDWVESLTALVETLEGELKIGPGTASMRRANACCGGMNAETEQEPQPSIAVPAT